MYKFHEEKKINMQQVSRTKISSQKVPRTNLSTWEVSLIKSVSEGKKNQCTCFTKKKKIDMQQVSWTQKKSAGCKFYEQKISKQHIPMNKSGFTRKKLNVRISREEKSTCNNSQKQKSARNNFHEQNQHARSSLNKNSFMRRKINVQV